MLNWQLREVIECSGDEAQLQLQSLMRKHNTDAVAAPPLILRNMDYRVEVWYNFNSARCVINAFVKSDIEYEKAEEIIDADVKEI